MPIEISGHVGMLDYTTEMRRVSSNIQGGIGYLALYTQLPASQVSHLPAGAAARRDWHTSPRTPRMKA